MENTTLGQQLATSTTVTHTLQCSLQLTPIVAARHHRHPRRVQSCARCRRAQAAWRSSQQASDQTCTTRGGARGGRACCRRVSRSSRTKVHCLTSRRCLLTAPRQRARVDAGASADTGGLAAGGGAPRGSEARDQTGADRRTVGGCWRCCFPLQKSSSSSIGGLLLPLVE
jgi:hypothetical protein